MLVPVETLIDGVVRTLTERVLPDVTTRFARGQLYTVIDVLRNLRDRIEPRAALLDEEADATAATLARVLHLLAGSGPSTDQLKAEIAVVPASPAAARAAAFRAAVVTALETMEGMPPVATVAARAAIAEHLAGQTMRDLAVLKPSLVGEISKG
jgi:hypothetical protein